MGLGSIVKGAISGFAGSGGNPLGAVLGAAGEVIGAVGKGKGAGPTQIQGFASLPSDIRDYLLKDILPRIKDYGASPYKGIPLRPLDESDLDPVFGSKARQSLQRYKDMMATTARGAEAPPPPKQAETGDSGLAAIGKMFLQTDPLFMKSGTSNPYWGAYQAAARSGADPEKAAAALGKSLSSGDTQALIELIKRGR